MSHSVSFLVVVLCTAAVVVVSSEEQHESHHHQQQQQQQHRHQEQQQHEHHHQQHQQQQDQPAPKTSNESFDVDAQPTITSTADNSDANLKAKLRDFAAFRGFISASTRGDDSDSSNQPSVFVRPQRHRHRGGDGDVHERHLTAKEARDLLFRGSDRGRLVPLNVSQLMPDNCQMHAFDQVVSYPGCDNASVRNYLCYGQCSSLFVPLEDDFIYSCTACLPTEFRSASVELNCPATEHKLRMHVKVVKACSCLTCSSQGMNG